MTYSLSLAQIQKAYFLIFDEKLPKDLDYRKAFKLCEDKDRKLCEEVAKQEITFEEWEKLQH